MSNTVACPSCQTVIKLDEVFAAEMTRKQKRLETEFVQKQKELEDSKLELNKKFEQKLSEKVTEKLNEEKKGLWVKAQEAAEKKIQEKLNEEYNLKIKDLEAQNKERAEKLKVAQEQELELRKKTRELEEKEKNLKLEQERQLDRERKQIAEKVKEDLSEDFRKKLGQSEQKIKQYEKHIEDLKRKHEQNSMQLQGDAQENDLKKTLEAAFVYDMIDDVPTGIRGADLIHRVKDSRGQDSGVVLWESKNTKSWQDAWLKKLKDDQAEMKADIAIIATTTMPDGIERFGYRDGVWVVEYRYVLEVTGMIRHHLIELYQHQQSIQGRDEKMQFLYQYLSGPQFKNRIENIVSAFDSMKSDLETEKRAMMRIWNKREKEIERMTTNTVGLYGDMQGIIALPTIDSLELPGGEDDIGGRLL